MKRFWTVLLSLGLIAAFSVSALAADLKVSGSYYVAGMYMDKIAVVKTGANDESFSTAFYFQRLRVNTEFVVSPGLSAVMSFDALERVLGGARTAAGVAADPLSAGTTAENQNIAFDNAYLSYATSVGVFRAGMMWGGPWGIQFGDTTTVKNRFMYMSPNMGGFIALALWDKATDNSYTKFNPTATASDVDYDVYGVGGIYLSKVFQFHLLLATARSAANRPVGVKTQFYQIVPAAVVKLGPVTIEAEIDYVTGKWFEMEAPYGFGTTDVKLDAIAGYLGAKANIGPAYVGAFVAYAQGQDPTITDKKTDAMTGGANWNPALIMFNYDLTYWEGGIAGITNAFTNAWMYQVNGGVNIDKLSVGAALTYATRDQVAATFEKGLGFEVDVTASYKITNNLSYMLGVGYLATGDYFKGANKALETRNTYLVTNRLTLTF